MDPHRLVALHPQVFHVAAAESWPSIRRYGLLSAARLIELHGVPDAAGKALLERRRATSTTLETPGVGVAVIRDQKPLKFIDRKIAPGSSLPQFLRALNSRVYFHPTRERLERLLGAREYRGMPQVVLTVDTASLVERYRSVIGLCRFNSGACTQLNHPVRGHDSWLTIEDYPYAAYKREFSTPLVEVTVPDAVTDILDLTLRVDRVTPPG